MRPINLNLKSISKVVWTVAEFMEKLEHGESAPKTVALFCCSFLWDSWQGSNSLHLNGIVGSIRPFINKISDIHTIIGSMALNSSLSI